MGASGRDREREHRIRRLKEKNDAARARIQADTRARKDAKEARGSPRQGSQSSPEEPPEKDLAAFTNPKVLSPSAASIQVAKQAVSPTPVRHPARARTPGTRPSNGASQESSSSRALPKPVPSQTPGTCDICQTKLGSHPDSSTTLECTHIYHSECVKELLVLGVSMACPLCLPELAGPEKLFEDATRKYFRLDRRLRVQNESWISLSSDDQRSMDDAIVSLRSAAGRGNVDAHCILGVLYGRGQGVKQDEVEAEYWYRKASEQANFDATKRGFGDESGEEDEDERMALVRGGPMTEEDAMNAALLRGSSSVSRSVSRARTSPEELAEEARLEVLLRPLETEKARSGVRQLLRMTEEDLSQLPPEKLQQVLYIRNMYSAGSAYSKKAMAAEHARLGAVTTSPTSTVVIDMAPLDALGKTAVERKAEAAASKSMSTKPLASPLGDEQSSFDYDGSDGEQQAAGSDDERAYSAEIVSVVPDAHTGTESSSQEPDSAPDPPASVESPPSPGADMQNEQRVLNILTEDQRQLATSLASKRPLFEGSLPKKQSGMGMALKASWKHRFVMVHFDRLEYGTLNKKGRLDQAKGSPIYLNYLMKVETREKGDAIIFIHTQKDEQSPVVTATFLNHPADIKKQKAVKLMLLAKKIEETHKCLEEARKNQAAGGLDVTPPPKKKKSISFAPSVKMGDESSGQSLVPVDVAKKRFRQACSALGTGKNRDQLRAPAFAELVKELLHQGGVGEVPSEADLKAAFTLADADEGGTVDESEFVRLYELILGGGVAGLVSKPSMFRRAGVQKKRLSALKQAYEALGEDGAGAAGTSV